MGEDDRLLTAAQVRTRYGGISDMGLWRWLKNPALKFPQPADRINGRRLWRFSDLQAWDASRAAQREAD
jgi:predicted DNA-binding transcriptional regulator AlpA